jgi:hypothetical protein
MLKKVLVGSLLASSLMYANNAEVNLNSDTLEVAGEFYLNDAYMLSEDSNYFLTANYLTSEDNTKKSSDIISLGLKMVSPYIDDRGFTLGLGMKAVIVDHGTISKNFYAAPLSASVKYDFNEHISFDGQYSYAPKILAFSDADSYKELKVTANYQIIDNGQIFIGKRSIKADYTNNMNYKFDSSVFFGYKVKF